MMMKYGVMSLTTNRVCVRTQPVVSLHQRNMANGGIRMSQICVMSSATEMHLTELITGIRSVSTLRKKQCDERDYDYYGPFYDQPHWQHSLEGGRNPGGVKAFSHDLKRVHWAINFKPSGIEKYDGSTNPAKWLEVYEPAIEAAGRDFMSWQIIFQYTYLHQPGHGSWDSLQG
jgi:hypothetical protein